MIQLKSTSKVAYLRDAVLEQIKSGTFTKDDPLPSEGKLSKTYGIGRNTVREAISSLVNEGYLVRIQGKGTYLRQQAVGLGELPKVKTVHLISREPDLSSERTLTSAAVLLGLHDVLDKLELSIKVQLIPTRQSLAELLNSKDESCLGTEGDCYVFSGYELSESDLSAIKRLGLRCVSIGKQPISQEIPSVDIDHFSGAQVAASYLFELGHTNIAMISAQNSPMVRKLRQQGLLAAYEKAGLEPADNWHIELKRTEAITKVVDNLFASVPECTAVILYAPIAPALICEFARRQMLVPEDMSIIQHATEEKSPEFTLTEISYSPRALARMSAQLLLDSIIGHSLAKHTNIMPAELIIGDSTSTPHCQRIHA